MKQAQILIDDINRMKKVVATAKSYKLRSDYTKAIKHKTKELIIYCQNKGLKFDISNCFIRN